MIRRLVAFSLVCGLALTCGTALGQGWTEVGDAGDFPIGGFQDTVGAGALTFIDGSMDWVNLGDHVDAYSIIVTDQQNFLASTHPGDGGFFIDNGGSEDDSRLWLFRTDGTLVSANDDHAGLGSLESLITDPASYPGALLNSPGSVTAGEKYILAVSYFDNNLLDAAGTDTVDFAADFDALQGPNPAAGPAVSWENPGDGDDSWTYRIALRGATYCVPEPGSLACLVLGLMGLTYTVRRRK